MVCLWWGCEMSVPLRQVNRMEVLLQHWHRMFVFWFQIFFFLFRAVLSLCLSCNVHQSLLFNTDTKITKFRHRVVSIWFGLVPYLYSTDGYYSADTFIFFFLSFLIHEVFQKLAWLGHERHTIPLYWVADCELHLEMWITLSSFFFFSFSFSSSTGIGTNTSLNQQCSAVVVIMKLSLMPTSFIKKTCSHLGAPSSLGTEIWR